MPDQQKVRNYCSMPIVPEREYGPEVSPGRASLIQFWRKKWANGTVLSYYFFDGGSWGTNDAEKQIVRDAFRTWKDVGIGLEFEEVTDPSDAEIRIGFLRGDGAWSYVGRDVLDQGVSARTMNFGWDLVPDNDIDTAIHEIGHSLGFPHEHQNPKAGIVWNEEKVYADLAGYPNYWSPEKTYHNIIRKIEPDDIQGAQWDSNSIMHYQMGVGWIDKPEQYRGGLIPEPGLSERDKAWVKALYPPLSAADYSALKPLDSVMLAITPGGQRNFTFEPDATREYQLQTFGESDTVMVLFEDDNGTLRYIDGDDDSGESYNSYLSVKLFKGRKYVVRIRLYYSNREGESAVMVW